MLTPVSVEYLINEFTRRSLPDLFEIPPQADLSVGCDVCKGGDHDHLRVECAWRVSNLHNAHGSFLRATAEEMQWHDYPLKCDESTRSKAELEATATVTRSFDAVSKVIGVPTP